MLSRNVDTATQLRKSGRSEIRYPYKEKLFYPLLWPAQAMSIDGNKIVLPMGRGRKSIVLDRPGLAYRENGLQACVESDGLRTACLSAGKGQEGPSQAMCMRRSILARSTSAHDDKHG